MKLRLLDVDLTNSKIESKELDKAYFIDWIGGRGLGAKLLSEENIEQIQPLNENNVVIISTSPIVGYAPCFNRIWFTTISPLTNYYLCTSAGGFFAGQLRKAGFECIRIRGKSQKPVYISITDGKATIEDTSELWGKDTDYTRKYLKEKHGGVPACIGQAGENLVRYANIQCDGRSAGRGGAGAVFGSKNLKAIIVKGSMQIPAENKQQAMNLDKELTIKVAKEQISWSKQGTLELIDMVNSADIFPTDNWRKSHFEDQAKIDFPEFEKKIIQRISCFKCPVPCTRIMKDKHTNTEGRGPEYETVWAFGPQCSNSDIEIITAANRLCDRYGMDTISTGSCIGFLKECIEKKLIEYEFDSNQAILTLIENIALRKDDLSKMLGEGTKIASQKIGKDSESFAIHQQGMEIPAYDPRGIWGMLLTYTLGPRHGCHLKAWTVVDELKMSLDERTTIKDKAQLVNSIMTTREAFVDSVSHCSFIAFTKQEVVEILSAVTGHKFCANELEEIGEKIVDLERRLDTRRGLTKNNDTLPSRIIEEQVDIQGKKVKVGKDNFEKLKQDFYKLRGW